MNKEEISHLALTLKQRGLIGKLKQSLRVVRQTISADTIGRAWKVEDYSTAPEALKLVLTKAKEIKLADDERISRELEMEAEPVTEGN